MRLIGAIIGVISLLYLGQFAFDSFQTRGSFYVSTNQNWSVEVAGKNLSKVSLPISLDSFTRQAQGAKAILQNNILLPEKCKNIQCYMFFGSVGDLAKVYLNNELIRSQGYADNFKALAKHYPLWVEIPQKISKQISDSRPQNINVKLEIESLYGIGFGLTTGPYFIGDYSAVRSTERLLILQSVTFPMMQALLLAILGILAIVCWRLAKLNPAVFNYGIFALAEAAFMLSFSFVPREYLSVTSASALHFSLRVLSDMALLECLNSVLKINHSLVSFMRIGFTAGLLWFGYLYMHQGTYPEFVFATEVVSVLIIAVPLVAFIAAIQAWNADRHLPVKKENNLVILVPTLLILTYSQIHDTMMFWGLFSGVYYVKFYLAPLAFALAVVLVRNQIRTFESLKKSKAEADKDAILGRIAWEFSHDLKSPLGALHDSALLALNDSTNQDYTKAVLESVVEKTTLVSSRIQQLFNYAKDQIQKKEKNNIKSLLNEIKSELEISLNAKNILLKIDVPDSNISIDAASIKRAIQNLVVNAIEASKENSEIHLQVVVRRNRLIFSVKDFGVGIDKEDLPHVFDPYFTKHKVDGTGLGLAIVDRISRQHGGFVQVFSKKDNGSTFVIEIPQ